MTRLGCFRIILATNFRTKLAQIFGNFFKWANPGLFYRLFSVFFKETLKLLQQKYVKKCPSNTRRWDSNPRPLEHESPLITTNQGSRPSATFFVTVKSGAFKVQLV